MNLITNQDVLNVKRELYKRSLASFVRGAWHVLEPDQKYLHGWHVDAICEHLEAITHGELNRLLINIPPGTMKSTLCNVFFPAWEWGPLSKPSTRIISAAHEASLSVRDTLKMRRLIESDWYQQLWPITMLKDQNQKTYYENNQTGFRQAVSVSSMTGKRGDRVIWDDPHSVEAAHSQANRETAIRVFSETLPSRLTNPDKSAIIIVMQRLHEEDVSGYILKNDFGYEHLCLPMEFESGRRCHTSIGFTDPRKEDGELLFPERFPKWVVDRDKKVMGEYAVAGQMQQRPAPLGGGLFKGKYWQYYKALPKIKYRMIFADTAQKATQSNDYSVFQCWGKGFDNNIYLIDQLRGKYEAPELLTACKQFWNKHKAVKDAGVLRALRIEDKVSGTGLIQTLQREGNIPVTGIPRGTDKVSRAHDVLPQVESGYVYLPEDVEWIHDYLSEFNSFPNGANDDQIDPTMDAINEMLINNNTDFSRLL